MSPTGICSHCRLPIERSSPHPNNYYYLFPSPHASPEDPVRLCPGSLEPFLDEVIVPRIKPESAPDDPMRF